MISKGMVLVTGASGFLGRRTVEMLVERDFLVRALVRKTSRIGNLKRPGVEICYGDVTDISSLKPAFEEIDFVVHAAADDSGTQEGARRVTIGGTRNIIELCATLPVRKLVYISSCSVYGPADYNDGQVIDENAPLERYPKRRGVYSWAKLESEKLVLDCMEQGKAAVTCLRPGTIYGPGGENYTPMMGFSLGAKLFVIIGRGDFVLPLVYVDNLVGAIIQVLDKKESIGKIYNVVDPDNPTKKQYVEWLLKRLYPRSKFIYVPYTIFSSMVFGQEILTKLLRCNPFLTRYRLISSQKNIQYDSRRLQQNIDWNPVYSFKSAIDKMLEYEHLKRT